MNGGINVNAIYKSIYTINYEEEQVISISTPAAFDDFVSELIDHISNNSSVRDYKTQSDSTEVISCIKTICNDIDNNEQVHAKMNVIAKRLLREEIEAQNKIGNTKTFVKKGSLIQALLSNEEHFVYLLAKVEHSEWVDDADFSFKTGFSKNKKTIWKSCLFDLSDLDSDYFSAKVYSDTKAQYWSKGFLELDEMNSDETNTNQALKAIDSTLKSRHHGIEGPDYTMIRNGFVLYMNNHEHIDFNNMVEEIVGNYQPIGENLTKEQLIEFKDKLLELPNKRGFDSQFNAVTSAINARYKKEFEVNAGIYLKVNRPIKDLSNTIESYEENGAKYLRIRTNNDDTYKMFNYKKR